MKKNILTALMVAFSAIAFAQAPAEKTIDNGYRLYTQVNLNGNYSLNEYLRSDDSEGNGFNYGAEIQLGYNINDFWGVFAQLAYNGNKSYHWMDNHAHSFRSIEPSINVTYNLTNGFKGFKPGRTSNLYLYGGPIIAFSNPVNYMANCPTERIDKTSFGFGIGLNYVYNLTNTFALTAKCGADFFEDKFSSLEHEVAIDSRLNLGVGLRAYLTKPKKPSIVDVHYKTEVVKYDTTYVTKQVVKEEQDVFPVYFEAGKDELNAGQYSTIKQLATTLQEKPSKIVYVLGYADAVTEDKANLKELARVRAWAITNELINVYGIDPQRIVTHDMGANVTPYLKQLEKNRSTICIVTDLKH